MTVKERMGRPGASAAGTIYSGEKIQQAFREKTGGRRIRKIHYDRAANDERYYHERF